MARVTTEQARQITSSNSNGYFSLKNDKDSAKVRFMYNTVDEIETYAVHEVQINGFTRHVDCLKDAEGHGTCPFCDKGVKRTARTFFKLYNIDKEAVEVWDCGLKRAPSIENILRMSRANQLVNDVFEIVRHGQAKATDTSYDIIYKATDDVVLQDLPKTPEVYGRFVQQRSVADMEYYITNNTFPDKQAKDAQASNGIKPRVNRNVF